VVKKSAFTLIELIFAIVIIAISVVSLPMMNQAIAKGIDANLVQEAIFAAATELNEAVTANWDEHSIEANLPNSYARVINTGDCNTTTKRMKGHIAQPLHRKCLNDTSTFDLNETSSAVVSLDDKAHDSSNLFDNETPSKAGYKKKYFSTVTVNNPVTVNGTDEKSLKAIVITITDEDGKILTQLKTFSANIGEIDYFKRSFL